MIWKVLLFKAEKSKNGSFSDCTKYWSLMGGLYHLSSSNIVIIDIVAIISVFFCS